MYLHNLFRSFQPAHNPIGFGVADFLLLAAAVVAGGVICLKPVLMKIAKRNAGTLTFVFVCIALRVILLPTSPIPRPSGSDDFSYVLLGDTLRHFRLANPAHALPQFFETNFVLQDPTYSSIYPLGQGLVLVAGRLLLGQFWAGVLLSEALFCGLVFWMLAGWTSRNWALAGGLLAVLEFGPLNQWMNSYWGGAVSACGGCLVFGALPRLSGSGKRPAVLLGLGLALQLLSRPFEFVLLTGAVLLYWAWERPKLGLLRWVSLPVLAGLGLTALQNHSVTGNWTTLPYMLSRYQYGVPTTFTFQRNPVPHRALTPEQELGYRAQAAIHGPGTDTPGRYLQRLIYRLSFLRFFLFAPLYLALLFSLRGARDRRWLFAAATILLFWLGTNFYPYFFPHYMAAIACLILLLAIMGLEKLHRASPRAAEFLLISCGAQFLFWYGIYLSGNRNLLPATRQETWDYINFGDPEGRLAIEQKLAAQPGPQLVFVRYWPGHTFHEWIHNEADTDRAKIVYAADLGAQADAKLLELYPQRTSWLLEPDAVPPRLTSLPGTSR